MAGSGSGARSQSRVCFHGDERPRSGQSAGEGGAGFAACNAIRAQDEIKKNDPAAGLGWLAESVFQKTYSAQAVEETVSEFEVHTQSEIERLYANRVVMIPPVQQYGAMAQFYIGSVLCHTSYNVIRVVMIMEDDE